MLNGLVSRCSRLIYPHYGPEPSANHKMKSISAPELSELLKSAIPVLLDVREPWEFDICQIPGSINVPMAQIPQKLSQLESETDTVVICHHGVRSLQVIRYLHQQSFDRLINLDGGVDAWARQVDRDMTLY